MKIVLQSIIGKNKWKLVGISIISLFIFLFLIYKFNFLRLLGTVPSKKELKNITIPLTTQVFTEDSILLCEFFNQNRLYTRYEEIPEVLKKGLIAVEDIRFYEHEGIDWQSNFAIIWYLIKGEKRGGSTITQQLVKNLFKSRDANTQGLLFYIPGLKLLAIKLKEWSIASKLEVIYTKEELLHLYLNIVDFGGNHFGLKTAAKYFFNKNPDELSTLECATLIGTLKASTTYHPKLHPNKCKSRRNTVLQLFKNEGIINDNQYDSLINIDVETTEDISHIIDPKKAYIKVAIEKELNLWCKENKYNLYKDGLKIYTTINSTIQKHAEDAVRDHMVNIQRKFFKHWEGEEPWRNSKKEIIPDFLINAMTRTPVFKSLKKKFPNNPEAIEKALNQPKKMKIFTWDGLKDTVLSSYDSLKYYKMILQAGFLSMSPSTGAIKSWVGSNDYRFFKYDHINQSKRQPGSTFKPFIYCTAIENGIVSL